MQAALLSAALFGAGTPLAGELLGGGTSPWLLAGLLYCGSGLGLMLYRLARRAPRVRLAEGEWVPLAGAVLFGGMLAPVLLMLGLTSLPSSAAALLLNAEGVFTALIAWFVFRENFDRRIALGMVAISAGAVVLSARGGTESGSAWASLAVLGACLCWGLDNNLTRKVALNDAIWLAAVKGGVAGPVNLLLALSIGSQSLPGVPDVIGALTVGFFAYGVSLALFIYAMRHVGTARAGAYFTVAPFFGALLAIALGDAITWPLVVAGLLMGIGVSMHLAERHEHTHTHDAIQHDHGHTHDDLHHDHEHDGPVTPGFRHKHSHSHEATTHAHEHYPDAHHRHQH